MTEASASSAVPAPAPELAPVPVTEPAGAKRPLSVLALVAFILVAAIAFCYMSVKILVVSLETTINSTTGTIATVLGALDLLSIVAIAAVIVLAHLALRKNLAHYRARILAAIALGAGYLLLALYFNRIIISIIDLVVAPHGTNFVQDNYYWL